ncbi:MAG TPA: hypothetical protein VK951_09270, partial [Miltoncostaeaceae bacterium]|nr:hypothetical protein [Miltoncostaeaceae bacterium]
LQVYYAGDTAGQVFPSTTDHGNSGTHVAVDGQTRRETSSAQRSAWRWARWIASASRASRASRP